MTNNYYNTQLTVNVELQFIFKDLFNQEENNCK